MATAPILVEPPPRRSALPSVSPAANKPPRKWRLWVFLAALTAAVFLAGLLWRQHLQNAIVFETVLVERGAIQSKVTASGNLNAVTDVLVSSQVSGNIKALYADWNSKVKKGQLVALIDPQIFQAQVDQSSAAVRSAHAAALAAAAQVEKAKSEWTASKAGLKNAEAIVAKDRANEANANLQWQRAQALFAAKVIAQQDYDSVKANFDAIHAQVAADEAQIDSAKQNIESSLALIEVAENQLAGGQAQERQLQAALQQAQINLEHTRILAPVDGTVVARRMDVGQTVAASLNPPVIFEIAQDLTKMQVDTNVDESDVGNIATGQAASFLVDSYPDSIFHGVVADIRKAPIITQNVVTYDVVITVENPDLKLFPGMTANVSILTAKVLDTLKVPNSALRFRPSAVLTKRLGIPPVPADKQQIYVLRSGTLAPVQIQIGLSDGRYTAIKATDLHAGDAIVTRATANSATSITSSPTPGPSGPRM